MNNAMVKRIFKLEKFFNVSKPKDTNWIEWSDKLYEMQLEWEEENNEEFPF